MIEQLTYLEMTLIALGAIPFIALLDYAIFYKHLRCMHCNKDMGDWRQFILPCVIESLFFIAGLSMGYFGRNGGMP